MDDEKHLFRSADLQAKTLVEQITEYRKIMAANLEDMLENKEINEATTVRNLINILRQK